ncbi:LemA protein [Trueperella bonasi]|uniref:LemA protein n=1 Tax=Trueperella bonasi TaxID=312286 RepID=A0ABT9NH60_9ACTO|nr:LemA family protein [Trueperella bonasi]MDP9806710.1 LemA protein [Trueperella bonasi]
MDQAIVIVIIVAALLVLYPIYVYNKLNRRKLSAERAWSAVDAYLQQRFDELNSLFEQLLTAFDVESKVFTEVSRLRAGITKAQESGERQDAIQAYQQANGFMLGFRQEAYPEMKSMDQSIFTASRTSHIETEINAARRVYNSNVMSYNVLLKNFPSNIVSRMFSHEPLPMFEAEQQARSRPAMPSANYVRRKYE